MNDKINIIIADDHPIFRAGLRQTIENDSRFKVVAEAADGETAVQLASERLPEMIVLDINMPKMNGFEVAAELHRKNISAHIIFLTMHSEREIFDKAMEAGAEGYVLKDSAATDILNCLNAVAAGQNFTSSAITSYLFRRAGSIADKNETLDELTVSERKILQKIAEYKTSKEIADEMFLSHPTIENYRTNICAKLNLQGSHSLIKFAVQNRDKL